MLLYYLVTHFVDSSDVTVVGREGFGERDNPHTSIEDLLNDTRRVRYMSNHLDSLAIAVRCGITF